MNARDWRPFQWFASFLIVVCLTLIPKEAAAYTWMIRHDYAACTQCHADPSGGGLLTEYGRAQGAILLASRFGSTSAETDEDPGTFKDFAFGVVPLPSSVLLGGDYRLLYLKQWLTPPNQSLTSSSRLIQMQADLQAQVTFKRLRLNGSLGYDHKGAAPAHVTHRDLDNVVSRVHWLGYDVDEDQTLLLRAGRMNIPYGLRTIEHESFVHLATRSDINAAQQHGVALAWNSAPFRAEIMGVVGNFQLSPDRFRERGYAAYAEWAPKPTVAVGVSSQVLHSAHDALAPGFPEMWRQSHGLFARYTLVRPLVLMAQLDALIESTPGSSARGGALGHASLLQADYEPWQGLHFVATAETTRAAASGSGTSYGFGGAAAWFLLPHFDLRVDLLDQSLRVAPGPATSSALLLAQIHGYL